jgi:hypothetical protein
MSGAKKIATMPRFSDLSIMNLALVLPAVPIPARTAVVPMRGATRKKTRQYEKLPPSKTNASRYCILRKSRGCEGAALMQRNATGKT